MAELEVIDARQDAMHIYGEDVARALHTLDGISEVVDGAMSAKTLERAAATLELAARGGLEASMRLLQIAEGMRALASAEGATPAASSRSEGASR